MLNWDDFRFFIELARCGSLSETARRLRTDHSTVGRRITSLESSLDLKLFDRLPRGYVLTTEGERLLERTPALEDAVVSIARLAGGNESFEGRVRISAPPAFASHWLVPRLKPLRMAHPGLVLNVVGETSEASLARREADLAIRLTRPEGGVLIARKLGELRYGLYGTRAYVETTPDEARVFLGYDEELQGSPQQRWIEAIAAGRPFGMLTNDLASLLAGTRAGLGLAALPHVIAEDYPELCCLGDGKAATRELWLVVHPDLRRSARVRIVMDFLAGITDTLRKTSDAGLLPGCANE